MSSNIPTSETDFALPTGLRWSGVRAGIKYKDRLDVGLCVAEAGPCSTAAVFTRNAFAAAPVLVSRELLAKSMGRARGVVVNAGCANAATGEEGMRNAWRMAEIATNACEGRAEEAEFLVCSTGTIGVQLPMTIMERAIKSAAKSADASKVGFSDFANSILTTDTRQKIASKVVHTPGGDIRLIGCAKGSGMMQPRMATMLAYVFTDAEIEPGLLQEYLSSAIERSLNCVTVDGDTSTNDTAIVMASGASGSRVERKNGDEFQMALLEVLQSLSRQLARDGEGASKLIEVEVSGAPDYQAAKRAALTVANSPLVKTAIYGRDANWGRIAMALGNAEVPFRVQDVTIRLGGLELFRQGAPMPMDEEAALKVLSGEFVRVEAIIGTGNGFATVWTCDFTEKYIEINGSYRT